MLYFESVVRKRIVQKDAVIEVKDLMTYLKGWFKDHKYKLMEGSHVDTSSSNADKRSFVVKWFGDREYDDYHKFYITLELNFEDMEDKVVRGKKLTKGEYILMVSGDIIKDYQFKWRKPLFIEFWRAVFDKYFGVESDIAVKKKIKNECDDLIEDIKKYFNMI